VGFAITASPAAAAPVTAVTLTSSGPSPQPAGTAIVFTAQAVGGVGPYQYQWYTFDDQHWTAVGGWGNSPTMTWSRNTADNYQVQVRVRSAGSSNTYFEAIAVMPFVLQ